MGKKSIIFLLFVLVCLSPSCAISQTHERSVSTIRHEDSLKPMEGLGDTVQVVAYLCGYQSEENDGDFHLYLEDDSCGLVARMELPSTSCDKTRACLSLDSLFMFATELCP